MYPLMLYRKGNEIEWEGLSLDTLIVHDEDGHAQATMDGWSSPEDTKKGKSLLDGNLQSITDVLSNLSDEELMKAYDDEKAGKTRKSVIAAIEAEVEKRG